jgi:hypothetical protein
MTRYLLLLFGDETAMPEPGTPESDADMAGYMAFDELAGEAIVGGEALHDNATCRTIRHEGGAVRVTDGPFTETVEGLGGFYVIEAPTLDDAIELTRHIPAVNDGGIEIRPMVQWVDRTEVARAAVPDATRWLATIHGPETDADTPGTAAWDAGAAEHRRFVEGASDEVLAAGAVQPTGTATTVRVRDGELLVTDGPYMEGMEVVGGVYVIRGTRDTAEDVARRVPVNPGGAVQLRAIMEFES